MLKHQQRFLPHHLRNHPPPCPTVRPSLQNCSTSLALHSVIYLYTKILCFVFFKIIFLNLWIKVFPSTIPKALGTFGCMDLIKLSKRTNRTASIFLILSHLKNIRIEIKRCIKLYTVTKNYSHDKLNRASKDDE